MEGGGGHVADRPQVLRRRLQRPVHLHVAAVELHPGLLVADAVRNGTASHRDETDLRLRGLRLPAGLVRDHHAAARLLDLRDLGARRRRDPALSERAGELLRDVLVLERRHALQRLDHRDVGAHRAVEGGELEPHGPGPDHHDRRRHVVEDEGLIAGDDPFRDLEPGEQSWVRAGREHHVSRLDLCPVDLHGRTCGELPRALDHVDLPRLDHGGQPADELVDDLRLELQDALPVGLALRLDAPLLGAVDRIHHRGGLEKCFRRDAAAEETGPAEAVVLLHERDLLAELGGADGAGVPTRARTEDDDVVGAVRHPYPFIAAAGCNPSYRRRATATQIGCG